MSTAAELLEQVEAQGVFVAVDQEDLILHPGSLLTPEQLAELRAHKEELLELVVLREWPEASHDAVRRFGAPHARLYPFLGRTIVSPDGPGRLVQVFSDRATVLSDADPSRVQYFLPSELRPVGVAKPADIPRGRIH